MEASAWIGSERQESQSRGRGVGTNPHGSGGDCIEGVLGQ